MIVITIDGPSASGKSTIARMLAKKLHYYYVCSGLLYRALAYLLINKYGYTELTVHTINADHIAECFDSHVFTYTYDDTQQERILFENKDITNYLKDSFIDRVTSITSTNVYVRHCVTQLQHTLAQEHDIVIDGRDVGSAVFPQAQVKFYLTASITVRAQRWMNDQNKRGHSYCLQEAIEKINDRDNRDKEREIAPLIIPDGAIIIDNSTLDIQETLNNMIGAIYKKVKEFHE
jgi:CMP/dCMP kinase